MHYTLHLTNNCNLSCKYCYVNKETRSTMSLDTARKVIDAGAIEGGSTGIVFFGGEPLLCKDIIYKVVEYARALERTKGCRFNFKVVTNGMLLDQGFIDFTKLHHIYVALSHDGIREAHDQNRVDLAGKGTYDRLSDKIKLLLSSHPYAPVMIVVNPETAKYYAASVKHLYNSGFKYIITSLHFKSNWTKDALGILKKEYRKTADFYYERTLKEDKFYLEPFETKIGSHIKGDSYCNERCELGKRQASVAPDGSIYPCVQFVGDKDYIIGHIDTGIDPTKQAALSSISKEEKESCIGCAVRNRCNHYCGCLNKQTTGSINQVSPVLCAHERLLLPIADKLAHKLFKKRSAMFIQKHYNEAYPIMSMIEDSVEAKHR